MSGRKQVRMVVNLLLAGWGAGLLAGPRAMAGLVSGDSAAPPVAIIRALGARRVAQHVLALAAPRRTVVLLSAATDALHAASMVAAAVIWPRYRRSALVSAGVATAAAALSVATAPPPMPHPR
jgi:hypothetical protein